MCNTMHSGYEKVICIITDDLKTLLTTTIMALKGAEQVNWTQGVHHYNDIRILFKRR